MSFLERPPIYSKIPSLVCRCCGDRVKHADLVNSTPDWMFFSSSMSKAGRQTITLVQGCESCADMDVHLAEAKADSRRYTEVSTFNKGCDWGARCFCGAVALAMTGSCVQCSRRSRMLDRMQAEQKQIAGLLVQLRREARNMKKELSHAS